MKAAIILLALLCAGCYDRQGAIVLTDDKGCKWSGVKWSDDAYPIQNVQPLVGPDGKQICQERKP